jgi:hypothetical protein
MDLEQRVLQIVLWLLIGATASASFLVGLVVGMRLAGGG